MTQEAVPVIAVAALVLAVLAVLLALVVAWRLRRANLRRTPTAALAAGDVGPAVERAIARLAELGAVVDDVRGRLPAIEEQGSRSVQRVGVVRFNPFEDTGSNQSFVLALLDSKADGVVISSLHSRQQTRIYLKPIVGGRSETPLSSEESEALRRAGVS